jgi:hypothetical protein
MKARNLKKDHEYAHAKVVMAERAVEGAKNAKNKTKSEASLLEAIREETHLESQISLITDEIEILEAHNDYAEAEKQAKLDAV